MHRLLFCVHILRSLLPDHNQAFFRRKYDSLLQR